MTSARVKISRTWKAKGSSLSALEIDLDRIIAALQIVARPDESDPAQVVIFNNSGQGTVQNTLYGRDSSGKVAQAIMGAASSAIVAKWLCLESVPPGRNFRAAIAGQYGVKAENLGTITQGQAAWVSTGSAGQVTETVLSTVGNRRQSVGQFAKTIIGDNSLISIDLALPGIVQVS